MDEVERVRVSRVASWSELFDLVHAQQREIDRLSAEIVRLRTDLIDMNDRRNKTKED